MFLSPGSRARPLRPSRRLLNSITPALPQGRLTATSGTPVTTSDVNAATTIYYAPMVGQFCPVFDGTGVSLWNFTSSPTDTVGQTLALDSTTTDTGYHQSGNNFDCFIAVIGSKLYFGTGPSWATGGGSTTARGTGAGSTALQFFRGLWTNANPITLRFGNATANIVTVPVNQATYVGTLYATSNGTTKDSQGFRCLWNAFNQVQRVLFFTSTTNTFNYSTAAFAFMDNSSADSVTFVSGLTGVELDMTVTSIASNSTTTGRDIYTGLGFDGDLVNHALITPFTRVTSTIPLTASAFYKGYPGLGKHTADWLIYGFGTDTQSWFGTASGTVVYVPGLNGTIWG